MIRDQLGIADPMRIVAKKIKAARVAAGLSHGQLGDAIGANRMTIGNLERGASGHAIKQLLGLALVLGVEPADLLPTLAQIKAHAAQGKIGPRL